MTTEAVKTTYTQPRSVSIKMERIVIKRKIILNKFGDRINLNMDLETQLCIVHHRKQWHPQKHGTNNCIDKFSSEIKWMVYITHVNDKIDLISGFSTVISFSKQVTMTLVHHHCLLGACCTSLKEHNASIYKGTPLKTHISH